MHEKKKGGLSPDQKFDVKHYNHSIAEMLKKEARLAGKRCNGEDKAYVEYTWGRRG